VGQNYGAGEFRRCREVVRKTLLVSWVLTMVVSILTVLTVNSLMGLFTDDPAIVEIGALRVKILMYGETLNVIMDNLSGAMRGLGKSMIPAVISFIGVCGTRITWVFTGFKIYHTFFSLMLVFPISWGVSALVIAIMWIRTRNKMLPV
jgi:Na+-driven multidrug efflux pump